MLKTIFGLLFLMFVAYPFFMCYAINTRLAYGICIFGLVAYAIEGDGYYRGRR